MTEVASETLVLTLAELNPNAIHSPDPRALSPSLMDEAMRHDSFDDDDDDDDDDKLYLSVSSSLPLYRSMQRH
eukprot:g68963.t1